MNCKSAVRVPAGPVLITLGHNLVSKSSCFLRAGEFRWRDGIPSGRRTIWGNSEDAVMDVTVGAGGESVCGADRAADAKELDFAGASSIEAVAKDKLTRFALKAVWQRIAEEGVCVILNALVGVLLASLLA